MDLFLERKGKENKKMIKDKDMRNSEYLDIELFKDYEEDEEETDFLKDHELKKTLNYN